MTDFLLVLMFFLACILGCEVWRDRQLVTRNAQLEQRNAELEQDNAMLLVQAEAFVLEHRLQVQQLLTQQVFLACSSQLKQCDAPPCAK